MTVCVAAICDDATIIAASDRMLTAGDVKFEPQQSKIVQLSTSIAALAAGDSAVQVEIFHLLTAEVSHRIAREPENWWLVKDVAELYSGYWTWMRRKRAEAAILTPLGLTLDTFMARQQEFAPTFIDRITTELRTFAAPDVQTIFTGVDPTGPHLYVVFNETVSCYDAVGFAAVGAGYWHANSQFMFAGHTRARPVPETLLLTYSAKKRAEVAPGVGEATDMFVIGPTLGSYVAIGDHVLEKLSGIYAATQRAITDAGQQAERRVNQFVEELASTVTSKDQRTPPDAGEM